MKIDDSLQIVFRSVADIVSPLYLVGGSVRDLLMGSQPHDYDFTTPLLPDDVEGMVVTAGFKPIVTGKRFGTIGFKLEDHFIEITTFRSEEYEPRSRKPRVKYVGTITHDLSRRDFTINAMALRLDGRIVDPFGGQEDIKHKIIRAVGNAGERFSEDPLRMLRAARFASQLDFTLDPDTQKRMSKRAHQILEISKERWTMELDKLLTAPHAEKGLRILAETRLLCFMLPELAIQVGFNQDSPYHELDLWEHTLKTVRLTTPDIQLRWAALLHDIGKSYTRVVNKRGYSNYSYHELVGAELVEKIGRYLKWSNERREAIYRYVRWHLEPDSPLHDADTAATKKAEGV